MCELYPDEYIKGLAGKDSFDQETKTILPNAFCHFTDHNSGYYRETSICWYDDDDLLPIMHNQRSSYRDDYQFKIGLAVLSKKKLDKLISELQRTHSEKILDYERRPTEVNKYHGNILLKKDLCDKTQKILRRKILQQICTHLSRYIPWSSPDEVSNE